MTNPQIVIRQGFRARLFQAHAALEAVEGSRISREEIGRRLGKALKSEAVKQSTVASWFNGVLPPADIGYGLAIVYGVSGGWLYFGQEPQAGPEPKGREPLVAEDDLEPRGIQRQAAKKRKGA